MKWFTRNNLWLFGLFLFCAYTAVGETVAIGTMNCYWFFSANEINNKADKPQNIQEYELKAGHLVGLLPQRAPLFIGLQEIGGGDDLTALSRAASARYNHRYQALFVKGKDTATGQNVGALFDASQGWGIYGKPSRVADLEKDLSKHLVVRLTNATAMVDICVVHLRRPIGNGGADKQTEQCRALLRWAMRHLGTNPKSNLVILGDFNEGRPVGSINQSLAVLFTATPPIFDVLATLSGKVKTHVDGKAYDRILISDSLLKGNSKLKLDSVAIQEHRHANGGERRLYTDHYPVVASFALEK